MDLGYEWLQEIVIHTEKGSILRLHIGALSGKYRLYGEFYERKTEGWRFVDFPGRRVADANALLQSCLRDFNKATKQKKDRIVSITNPCNALYVSTEQQLAIAQGLGINANISVN